MTLIAHVSDTHLDGTPGSLARVERVVERLESLHRPVDAVLLTGDIADHGRAEEYAAAKAAFGRLGLPLLWLPGNHDVRRAFLDAGLGPLNHGTAPGPLNGETADAADTADTADGPLNGDAAPDPINRAERIGAALFALCDSTIPGRNDGRLDDTTLEWLDAALDGSGPAFVCFHHPPVEIGHPYADRVRQFGEERLAALLARHPQVVAILCGHFHTATVTTFAGRPLVIAPGVASTLVMPWERDGGDLDRDAPPGLAFHDYRDGRLTTHFRTI